MKIPKLKILHFLDISIRSHFIRTVLSKISKDIEYILLINNNKRFKNDNFNDFLEKISLYANMIFIENNMDQIEILKHMISDIKPDILLLTTKATESFIKKLNLNDDLLKCTFFITHGIASPYLTENHLSGWSRNIKYIYYDNIMDKCLNQIMDKSNLFRINGLPQFDILIKNKNYILKNKNDIYKKYHLDLKTKTIFIVHDIKYHKYVKVIIKFYESYFNKFKINCFFLIKKKCSHRVFFQNKKNVVEINFHEQIYNYLCCDFIFIMGYSTSFVESMLISENIILLDTQNDTNYLNKYKSLKICNNIKNLKNINIKNNIENSDKILFQKEILGGQIEYSTDKIVFIFKNNSNLYTDKINKYNKYLIKNNRQDEIINLESTQKENMENTENKENQENKEKLKNLIYKINYIKKKITYSIINNISSITVPTQNNSKLNTKKNNNQQNKNIKKT